MPKNIWPREFYIPSKNAVKIADENSTAVVYTYDYQLKNSKGVTVTRYGLMSFSGRAQKPRFHFYYNSEKERQTKINSFFDETQFKAISKDIRKEYEAAKERGLEVGDVLYSSWGYEQTNIDYYQVTRLVGKKSVEIRQIGSLNKHEDGFMTGTCSPAPNFFIGDPMVKRAKEGYVKLTSYSGASKCLPTAIHRWTSYH